MSIYNEIFPEKKKATKIPMVNYAIKLSLLAPNNNYNFMDEECDGIDIKGTFFKVVNRYNGNAVRKVDKSEIHNVEVRAEAIIFTLRIKAEKKNISTTIGNSISKWLYTDYYWKRLTAFSDTKRRQKLFSIQYFRIK